VLKAESHACFSPCMCDLGICVTRSPCETRIHDGTGSPHILLTCRMSDGVEPEVTRAVSTVLRALGHQLLHHASIQTEALQLALQTQLNAQVGQ